MSEVTMPASASAELARFAALLNFGELSWSWSTVQWMRSRSCCEAPRLVGTTRQLRALDVVAAVNSSPEVTVVGRSFVSARDMGHASNAAAAQASTDVGARSVERQVCDVVAAAALSAAEFSEAEPADLLVGVVAGLEVVARIAVALGVSHIERGWRVAGTAGRVGAAVAVARTLRRDADELLAAVAFAATQAAGFAIGTGVKCPRLAEVGPRMTASSPRWSRQWD